jgi:phthiodiolone/phenolphthiodiolone dimycocerosates ketoreductase
LIEALATIRALWDSNGELVSRDSPFFPLHNAVFDLPPYKGKWPEIWVAAHGPRMLRATGRYADGWFPAVVFRPQDYAESLGVVRAEASDAGRDPLSITPAMWFFVLTGRNGDEIDDALKSPIMKALTLNFPAETWTRHGARHPFGDDFGGGQDIIPQVLDEETVARRAEVAAQRIVPYGYGGRGGRQGGDGVTTACAQFVQPQPRSPYGLASWRPLPSLKSCVIS